MKATTRNPLPPWKIFYQTVIACTFLAVVTVPLAVKKVPRPLLDHTKPLFDGQKAFQEVEILSKRYPNRVTWSEIRKKAAIHLKDRLQSLGYKPQGMTFSEVIAGQQIDGLENVYAIKRGTEKPDEIITLVAHYDTPETSTEGAMDDGSGVGVVLELARVFAKIPTRRTIVFLLSDSEEFGALWGSHVFLEEFAEKDKIVAALNFDFVNLFDQVAILTTHDGLKEGYTPLWLREIVNDSIRSLGKVEAREMNHVLEHIQRSILIPASEHGEFLRMGIPALNMIGQNDDFATLMKDYHHTKNDLLKYLKPSAMQSYGEAAERALRSIDRIPSLPRNFRNGDYWKLTPRLYLDGGVVLFLHILSMIPFLVITIMRAVQVFNRTGEKISKLVVFNEIKNSLILIGSLLFGYGVLLLLPYLKVITQYETYPATQKSEILYHPNLLAIALVIAAVGAAFYLLDRVFSTQHDALHHPEVRQTTHGILLAIVIFLAFTQNSYLATLMLLPPAYLWLAVRWRKDASGRVLNGLLVLSGAITLVVVSLVMSQIFHIGVFYWYLFLSAAYGLFSAYSIVLGLVVIALMARMFKRFVIRKAI